MRKTVVINKNRKFQKGVSAVPEHFPSDWEITDLPYTWNGVDGQDGGNDYFRAKLPNIKEENLLAVIVDNGNNDFVNHFK